MAHRGKRKGGMKTAEKNFNTGLKDWSDEATSGHQMLKETRIIL